MSERSLYRIFAHLHKQLIIVLNVVADIGLIDQDESEVVLLGDFGDLLDAELDNDWRLG